VAHARISFGLGTITATADQKLLYMRCLASIVKRGFRLGDTLPAVCSDLSAFMIEAPTSSSSADASAALSLTAYAAPSAAERRMTLLGDLGQRFMWTASQRSVPERHAFLAVWAFAAMSESVGAGSTALTVAHVDPLALGTLCASAGFPSIRDFVAAAA
jgi:hypothetical protein